MCIKKISELPRLSKKGERSGFINYLIGYEHLDGYFAQGFCMWWLFLRQRRLRGTAFIMEKSLQ